MKRTIGGSIAVGLIGLICLCFAMTLTWPRANGSTASKEDIAEIIDFPTLTIKKSGGHVQQDGTYLECKMNVEGCSLKKVASFLQQLEIEVLGKRTDLGGECLTIKGEPPFESLSIIDRRMRIVWNPKSDVAHHKVKDAAKEFFF